MLVARAQTTQTNDLSQAIVKHISLSDLTHS